MTNTAVQLLAGLAILLFGAELLVRGASQLARVLGIPPLLIGLTVVAFGTSAPELTVSVRAALEGSADISVGNVVGSNIFNVLLILGLCATIVPLRINEKLLQFDAPAMIAVSVVLAGLALDRLIGRFEGMLLIAGLIAYLILIYRRAHPNNSVPVVEQTASVPKSVIYTAVGLFLLIYGAGFFVDASVDLARFWGVSELVIGVTIVAAGTSLPEVATSLVASFRGERDLAVGNVVGSNIFNILAVLGLSAAITPLNISPDAVLFDLPVMVTVAVLCYPVFWSRGHIDRWEGFLFLLYYVLFCALLLCNALLLFDPARWLWHLVVWTLPLLILAYTLTLGARKMMLVEGEETRVLSLENRFEMMRRFIPGLEKP